MADVATLALGGGTLVLALLISCYTVLVFLSPPLAVPSPKDKVYRSRSNPETPRPLPSVHDAATLDLTVVVPAYNETARMPAMLDAALAHLTGPQASPKTYEILVVDDGSTDGTSELALDYAKEHPHADMRVVTLSRNLGKGGAVRHGMVHARGRRIIFADADGASKFADVEQLWKAMDGLAGGDDSRPAVAIGSRAHLVKTEAVVKRSLLRNILMYGLHTILRLVGVGHIRDTQCGFKLFSRAAAQRIFPCQHLTTWIFDVEVLLLAKQLAVPVAEVPIAWHEVSGSKLNVVTDSLQMLRDLLVLRANVLVGRWKAPPVPRK